MNRIFLLFRAATVLLLVAGIWDWSYSYYSLLRVATTFAAIEVCWVAVSLRKEAWLLPFAAVVVLWNPLAPVHLPKQTWRILDATAAVLLACSIKAVARTPMFGTTKSSPGSASGSVSASFVLAFSLMGLASGCGSPPPEPPKLPKEEVPGNIDPIVEEVGRFTLATAGDRVVRVDTKTGNSWLLDTAARQWVRIEEQPFGRFNPATKKVEWVIAPKRSSSNQPTTYYDENGNPAPPTITDPAEALRILEQSRTEDKDPLKLFSEKEDADRLKQPDKDKPQ